MAIWKEVSTIGITQNKYCVVSFRTFEGRPSLDAAFHFVILVLKLNQLVMRAVNVSRPNEISINWRLGKRGIVSQIAAVQKLSTCN